MIGSRAHGEDGIVMVIDIGSSAVKVAAFSVDGSLVASQTSEYPTRTPGVGLVEQDAKDWWASTVRATNALIETVDFSRLRGITVTNQQVTTVPVNEDLSPQSQAISWMDTRTSALAEEVKQEIGDRVLEIVGMPVSPSWAALRPKWWMENQRDIADGTRWYLSVDAYFYGRLTGRVVSDQSNACFGPFDVRRRTWSTELAGALGIDIRSLPNIVEPTELVGPLSDSAASELQLPPGVPVIAGASDQPASALGLGATSEDTAAVTIGTGTFVVIPTSQPVPDDRYLVTCAALPGKWIKYGLHYVSGAAVDWLVDFGGFSNAQSLADDASKAPPGSGGIVLLPYFQGARTPHFDDRARAVIFGLTLAHRKEHIARAFLESNAFGIRHLLETMESSKAVDRIRLAGGGSASPIVPQLIADVTRRKIEVPTSVESTALGAALIAWTGLGLFSTVNEAAAEVADTSQTFVPNARNFDIYEKAFRTYLSIYSQLRGLFGEALE